MAAQTTLTVPTIMHTQCRTVLTTRTVRTSCTACPKTHCFFEPPLGNCKLIVAMMSLVSMVGVVSNVSVVESVTVL